MDAHSALAMLEFSDGGSRPFSNGIKGVVMVAIPTPQAGSVVLCPYLSSRTSMMNGMAASVILDDADMSPNAIPLRTTHINDRICESNEPNAVKQPLRGD